MIQILSWKSEWPASATKSLTLVVLKIRCIKKLKRNALKDGSWAVPIAAFTSLRTTMLIRKCLSIKTTKQNFDYSWWEKPCLSILPTFVIARGNLQIFIFESYASKLIIMEASFADTRPKSGMVFFTRK